MNELRFSVDTQISLVKQLETAPCLADMLTWVLDRAGEILPSDASAIYIVDANGQTATQVAGTGYKKQFVGHAHCPVSPPDRISPQPTDDERLGILGWIISTGKTFLARNQEDLRLHPHYSWNRYTLERPPGKEPEMQTFLGIPIQGIRREVVGLIEVERCADLDRLAEPFSINDRLTLETIAHIVGKCLWYSQMVREGETDAAVTAWARDIIPEVAGAERELDDFLDAVVKVTAAAMSADACSVYLIDESRKTLTQRAGIGSQTLRYVIRSYLLPIQDQVLTDGERVGLTAYIAATGQSIYARNFSELVRHPHHRGQYDLWNFPAGTNTVAGAFLGVSLRVGDIIIGVLKVENVSRLGELDERSFSESMRRRFELLAQDIALSIVRLQTRDRMGYSVIQEAQSIIFDILRGGLSVPELVQKVTTETAGLFNARACSLFLKEGDRLVQSPGAAFGWAAAGPSVREYLLVDSQEILDNPTLEEKVGLTVWIAVKRQKFVAKSNLELRMHPHHRGTFDVYNFQAGERCESFMGVPLLIADRLIGVLKVETKMRVNASGELEITYFTEQDELVFDLIANSAAVAIENARLYEELRELDRRKSEFLSTVSHELRTPLTPIKSCIELTLAGTYGPLTTTQRARMEIALASANDEARLIENLLDLVRIEEGRAVLSLEEASVTELVQAVVQVLEYDAARKRIGLQFRLPGEPLYAVLDKGKIKQVVTNLLTNAIKFTSEGGMITISVSANERWIEIQVKDTGIGIPADEFEKIFERLHQVDSSLTRKAGGMGIGLNIVKEYVEMHGGRVWVQSEVGRGSTFTFSLPRKGGHSG